MKKLVVLVLLLAGCGYAGDRGYDWFNTQVREPVSPRSQPVGFHVEPGEGTDAIATDLAAKGLIRNPNVFVFYLRYQRSGARLEAGDFVLNRNMTMNQIIDALGQARVQQVMVTLPEGKTMKQLAQAAQQAGLGTAQDYLAAAQEQGWSYEFLKGRPAGAPANLEGFLFPDTYQLDRGAPAHDLVKLQGPLTEADKQHDTPYNTYLHPGLPAGPISNPGSATVNACLNPQKSQFLYFFADAKGETRYARTYAEHQQQQQQFGLAP